HLTYLSTATILFFVVPMSTRFVSWPKVIAVPANLLLSGIILQLVLMPYIAFIFHRIAIYSIASNMIAVPLSSVLIALSVVFLPFKAALLLAPPIHQLMLILNASTTLFSESGVLILASPGILAVILFYLCLFVFVITRST